MVASPRNHPFIENKPVISGLISFVIFPQAQCPKIHWPAAFRITATPRFLKAEPK
jgi:hypothetical protein